MIRLYINPEGIRQIVLASRSDVMADIDWTTWKSIRLIVNTLDAELRLVNQGVLKTNKGDQEG